MPRTKREKLNGRGASGKAIIVGVKDRTTKQVVAQVVTSTDRQTLQGFVEDQVEKGATVYTDEHSGYQGLQGYNHQSVKHSVGEYVRDMAHTNGIESFWSMLKRAHTGTFHKMSPKHLQRYVNEFTGRQGIREKDTQAQMAEVVTALVGRQLAYRQLIGPST